VWAWRGLVDPVPRRQRVLRGRVIGRLGEVKPPLARRSAPDKGGRPAGVDPSPCERPR
jgi:hypothetical protein